MDGIALEQLIRDNLSQFKKADAINARYISKALHLWSKERNNPDFIDWWTKQNIQHRAALHSYLFWLWTQAKKIEGKLFEDMNDILIPTLSKAAHVRVEITTGSDKPNISAGFLKRKFSVLQYEFSPSDHAMDVTFQAKPESFENRYSLDLILDYLSFLVNKHGEGFLGFRQIPSSKWNSSETEVIHIGMRPAQKIQFLDYDFNDVEEVLRRIGPRAENQDSFLLRLLHVRHHAILESSIESKLIALWAFIEDLWGKDEENREDKLLTKSERKIARDALSKTSLSSSEKFKELIDTLSKIKRSDKTQTQKITQKIKVLECGKEWDNTQTNNIRDMRGQFAHGNSTRPDQESIVQCHISFLLTIINELIAQELSKYNIK